MNTLKSTLIAFFAFSFTLVAQDNSINNPPTDNAIALAVKSRLVSSDEVRSSSVEARVADGVVTLTGKVDNLHASLQAVRIARNVRGVKSVLNQIVPLPGKVSDKDLEFFVKDSLAWSPDTDSDGVTIGVKNGEVTLEGIVPSLADKKLAETEIASIRGVKKVNNLLEVASIDGVADPVLESQIKALLEASALLDNAEITVVVKDKVASLSGTVATLTEKQAAVDTASISGITLVSADTLTVDWKVGDGMTRRKRYEGLTDDKIAESIQLAIGQHPGLAATRDNVEVEVTGGKVDLSGTVARLSMKEAATECARNTIGVQGIRNRIQVEWPENAPSDDKISKNSTEALSRDAYLSHAEIIPRTRNAHVHLYGSVDTKFEKKRAQYIVGSQPGVVHVANYLTVLGGWDEKPDDEIKEDILRELELLRTDPHVDVTVDVKGGVPIFSGHVATWLQWQGLLRIAEEAGGRRPHNNVTIHYRPQGVSPGLYVPR